MSSYLWTDIQYSGIIVWCIPLLCIRIGIDIWRWRVTSGRWVVTCTEWMLGFVDMCRCLPHRSYQPFVFILHAAVAKADWARDERQSNNATHNCAGNCTGTERLWSRGSINRLSRSNRSGACRGGRTHSWGARTRSIWWSSSIEIGLERTASDVIAYTHKVSSLSCWKDQS